LRLGLVSERLEDGGKTMSALGHILTRLAVFGGGCLMCIVWFDIADAGQAARRPARASGPPPCTCDDKPAMQRDIDDAKWLADAHRQKAEELQKAEDALYRAMGKSIADRSSEMSQLWSGYNSWEGGSGPGTARGAFEAARKYTGSIVVSFDQNTNRPDPAQLERARNRAACLRIADGISFHEQKHTDIRAAGGGQYSRPSQLALEEANHYDAEAKFVQDGMDALNCPRAQGTTPDNGERYALRELLQRAVTRVTAYAASIS
jgi:hypothetical protein